MGDGEPSGGTVGVAPRADVKVDVGAGDRSVEKGDSEVNEDCGVCNPELLRVREGAGLAIFGI